MRLVPPSEPGLVLVELGLGLSGVGSLLVVRYVGSSTPHAGGEVQPDRE